MIFSWFSFRQTAPVQGACGGRAPRSRPKCLSGKGRGGRRRGAKRSRNVQNMRIPSKMLAWSHSGTFAHFCLAIRAVKFRVKKSLWNRKIVFSFCTTTGYGTCTEYKTLRTVFRPVGTRLKNRQLFGLRIAGPTRNPAENPRNRPK